MPDDCVSREECLKTRMDMLGKLHDDGCKYCILLRKDFDNFKRSQDSKVENFETVAQGMLDLGKKNQEELGGLKAMTRDAVAAVHASQKAVHEMEIAVEDYQHETEKENKEFKATVNGLVTDLGKKFDGIWWKILLGTVGGNAVVIGLMYFIFGMMLKQLNLGH